MSWRHVEAAGLLPITRPPVKAVLIAIAHHTNDHSGKAWPGLKRLSLFTGLNERSVRRSIRELETMGLLTTRLGSGRTSSVYVLTLPGVEPITITDKSLPPEALGPEGTESPPSSRGARESSQGGLTGTPARPKSPPNRMEREHNASDGTRARSEFDEDWRPSEQTIVRIRDDEGLSNDEIEGELHQFILTTLAGDLPRNPEAAFRAWCAKLRNLKRPPAKRPARKAPTEIVIDAAYCRRMVENATNPQTRASWAAKLRELESEAA